MIFSNLFRNAVSKTPQALRPAALIESSYDLLKTSLLARSFSSQQIPSLSAPFLPTPAIFSLASFTTENLWRAVTMTSSSMLERTLGGLRYGSTSKLTPPFIGKKLKPFSAYKSRFKMTGTGKIRYMRPGRVHKRYNKGRRQLAALGDSNVMQETYAKTMRKLGFTMRRF